MLPFSVAEFTNCWEVCIPIEFFFLFPEKSGYFILQILVQSAMGETFFLEVPSRYDWELGIQGDVTVALIIAPLGLNSTE